MTQEEKAKAYDEAIKLARDYYKANLKLDRVDENLVLEDIFPELKESEDEYTISFGAFDSELIEETYFIPEGMEAVIEGDKVIIRRKESEDERIRKELIQLISCMHDADHRKKDWLAWIEKQGEQKPAWSEEDKNFMYNTLSNLTELKDRYGEGYGNVGKCIDWLKSLRPQNRWISVDEEVYVKEPVLAQKKDKSDSFGGFVVCCDHTLTPNVYERYMILGNIVSQNRWKPSDEQMDVLLSEVTAWTKGCPKQIVLESLYNDLKKLKG